MAEAVLARARAKPRKTSGAPGAGYDTSIGRRFVDPAERVR